MVLNKLPPASLPHRTLHPLAAAIALICLGAPSAPAAAAGACTTTAIYMLNACNHDAQDNYWVAAAKCVNEPDASERTQCFADAKTSRTEDLDTCQEQRDARATACELLGEGRYDPPFEPNLFDKDFTKLTAPNPYFPLKIGNKWTYKSNMGELNTVEMLNKTKLIDEVRCLVTRDIVYADGLLSEATDDWFASAKNGTVWYCGEETKSYEFFKGDNPQAPELVDIDGSFKADRDDDKPGIIFEAHPKVGDVYLEEFSLGNAEDTAEVFSTTYSYGTDKELDKLVPAQLAKLLCSGKNCVVTQNTSQLEPGVIERKYYARGIGVFLETDPDSGEVTQLVDCNFDTRCQQLPQP